VKKGTVAFVYLSRGARTRKRRPSLPSDRLLSGMLLTPFLYQQIPYRQALGCAF
jgi:hypothetical protein